MNHAQAAADARSYLSLRHRVHLMPEHERPDLRGKRDPLDAVRRRRGATVARVWESVAFVLLSCVPLKLLIVSRRRGQVTLDIIMR
jgi:hypothetical protein